MTKPATAPTTFAEAEAVLAEALPGYESRPQQQALAQAVEALLSQDEPTTLLGQAGCGTGKSLGLMIPAILSGRRVLVATATKALMEQYVNNDVPFLEKHLGVPFKWAMLKGRSNYFCHAKAAMADASRYPWIADVRVEVDTPEHDGDFEHVAADFPRNETYLMASSSAECPGTSVCPFGTVCKSQGAKNAAALADLVVTNTAMLMTDLVIREKTDGAVAMLGEYDVVLIDEAHEVEEWATSALSEEVKRSGIESMLSKVDNFAGVQGANLDDEMATVRIAMDSCWKILDRHVDDTRSRDAVRLTRSWFLGHGESWSDLVAALRNLAVEVGRVQVNVGDARREGARQKMIERQALNAAAKIEDAIFADDDTTVRWAQREMRRERGRSVEVTTLNTAPVHVGPFLNQWLWSQVPVVLASATLAVGNDFSYISERLGIESPSTLDVGTPFDYTTQARLFIPAKDVPTPKDRGGWMTYTANTTLSLIDAAGGGALLLFTSRKAMQDSYQMLSTEITQRGHTVLMQGQDGTNKEIAARFEADKTSVLFALKSFFTGVDFRGDTCRLVVIDKMPFPVPSDPVFAARSEQIKRRGGSDFAELSVPSMSLTLIQGFGRLIRSKSDTGIVAILDSRLSGTGYGKGIVRSLPASPQISTTADAARFFKGE